MKSLLVFVFLFLLLLAGCSSEKPVTPTTTAAPSTPQPAVAKVPVEPPKEPELTPEQIAHNERVAVAVRVIQLSNDGGENKNLPKWVADHRTAYEGQDYPREKVAFSRSVGWGTGMYKGKQFYWFAYTNTDAWLQFDFSVPMTADDLGKVIGGRKDGYGRFREAELPNGNEHFTPGTATWIGDTNDWTDANCTVPHYDKCDIGAALDKSVADLNKDLPELKLTTKGKFPW